VNVLGPSLHYQPTIWSIRNQKYLCKPSSACPSTITELAKVKDIKYRHHISQAIKQQVMIQLTTNESQIDIAKELGISDWTVRRVIFNLDQFFKPNYHWLPRHIAFDDFKSGRFAPSGMSMILMNIENHRTIDIILSRRNRYLRNYFPRYDRAARLAVRTVTVDLYTPYRHLIHELFPHAIIIADHFHVVAQAYRALNKIRVKAMNQAGNGSHQWRALKHFWKLILTPAGLLKYDNYWSRRNFGYTQLTDVEVIQRLLAFNDDLKQAYRYYQDLILAINHRSKDELNHLLAIKWTQLPQSLQKVQRTLQRHLKEIITSFKYGDYTNGPVEGTNNKIKAIKRTAYGFRNFFNFRARILLALPNSYFAINWKNKRTAHVQSQTRAV
ncbi:ISL3 family transposase, partial [Lactobacillus kefiranofaciens]|nr:ISL3 family transposase [Lactobacillus kefiranofaciens]